MHAHQAHVFLCIRSSIGQYSEAQLYTKQQIFNPLLKLLKNSNWVIGEEIYAGIWKLLRITNKNLNILFVPIVCIKCFPKFDDDIAIMKDSPGILACTRCKSIWVEEAYKLVVGTKPHIPLGEFT